MVMFSTDPSSVTGRNLGRDPRLVVHLESGDEVAILEGEVRPLEDDTLFEAFADAYDAKYDYRPQRSADSPAWSLRPTKVLSWREADFRRSATRWSF
jgi:hypothetical protein